MEGCQETRTRKEGQYDEAIMDPLIFPGHEHTTSRTIDNESFHRIDLTYSEETADIRHERNPF